MDGISGQFPAWTVFVGPGPRLAPLPALLGALRPDPSWEVRSLADVDELFGALPARGRLVLDSDVLLLEDLGFVSRFIERNEGWELVLTGADPTGRAAKRLMVHGRARWLHWPLDVDQLGALWEAGAAPGGVARPPKTSAEDRPRPALSLESSNTPFPAPAPPDPLPTAVPTASPAPLRGQDEELDEIRSILEGPPDAQPRPASPALSPQPRSADGADQDSLPGFYRQQVADLADIAQRLQLSTHALHESGEPASDLRKQLDGLDQDVARLLQFTRTLSFLAAPPVTGDQRIDVGGLLEELLGSLAGSTPDAPRYLFRAAPGLAVRSDKMLLVQAFDAMLQLATRCAGADDVVRVAAHAQTAGRDTEQVEVRISFPAGPLTDLEPDQILRPYTLRRALPSIGPNALAAARGIIHSQGGVLDLDEIEPGRLTWIARFPTLSSNGQLTQA